MQEKDGLDGAFDKLDEDERRELDSLREALRGIKDVDDNNVQLVKDKELKKRVARCILRLVKRTGQHEELIQETSYVITGYFIGYRWGDDLGEVIGIAGELELPKEHVSGDIFEMFAEMKTMLERYISSQGVPMEPLAPAMKSAF